MHSRIHTLREKESWHGQEASEVWPCQLPCAAKKKTVTLRPKPTAAAMYTPAGMQLAVRPYSTWLAYDVVRPHALQRMLPKGTRLANARLLADDPVFVGPKLLFNVYQVDATFMKGHRVEVCTLVRSRGGVHFVVLDVLSNTMMWNPHDGIRPWNAVCRTHVSAGEIDHASRHISAAGADGVLEFSGVFRRNKQLLRSFAVDANHYCFYRDTPTPLGIEFDDEEIMHSGVRRLVLHKLNNTLWSEFRGRLTHSFAHTRRMRFAVASSW